MGLQSSMFLQRVSRQVGIPGRGLRSDRCAWLKLIGGSNLKAIDWRDEIYNYTYCFGASGWARLDEVPPTIIYSSK